VAIMQQIWRREGPVAHDGKEIQLPYAGPGATGLGKPLKSILHGNPRIPVWLGTATPGNIRMTAEIADGWLAMHLAPDSYRTRYRALIEEGLARRSDGKTLADFEVRGSVGIQIVDDVRTALDAMKPGVALYTGGMGARSKNFHKEAMIERGFAEAAERIQELFLAGRKDEAAAAVPDEYIDDEALIGPPARIRERWRRWLDSGLTSMALLNPSDEAIELMAQIREG
jgi:F420-dependent oxidoreductase-like protein